MVTANLLLRTQQKPQEKAFIGWPAAILLISVLAAGCQVSPPTRNTGIEQDAAQTSRQEAARLASRELPPLVRGVVATSDTSSDLFIHNLYELAKDEVSQHFDIDLEKVELKLAYNKTLEGFVERETAKLSHAVFTNTKFADLFLSTVMEDQSGTYAGLYVSPENMVVINRELLDIFRQSLIEHAAEIPGVDADTLIAKGFLALLIHELVHAADNERFQIHANRQLNFRASVAQSAVFEGHAQMATREICKQFACLAGLKRLDSFMFEAPEPADPVARSLQAVSRNVLEYAYVEGERFLTDLKKGPNGEKRLEAVLRNPPEDPVQILDPDNFPDQQRIWRNKRIFKRLQSVEHRWNSSDFAFVETSPIKGLDLRKDPERRAATKEGFTRLIQSMVGAQLFDQAAGKIQPIEITVMQTDNEETAKLFSQSFFEKAARAGSEKTRSNTLHLKIGNRASDASNEQGAWPMRVFLTFTELTSPNSNNPHHINLVANAGNWIIQMGGIAEPRDSNMLSFSEQAMLALLKSDELDLVANN